MNKQWIVTVLVALLVGAGAFYGGIQYNKNKGTGNRSFGNFQQGGFVRNGGNRNQGQPNGERPVSGEILSQDDNSITVKLPDGSSKIIILSGSTTINKATEGTKEDLKTGERVAAFGTTNPDGSITAQNISIGGGLFRGFGQGTPMPTPAK